MSSAMAPMEKWLREAFGESGESLNVNASSVRGLPAAWYSINKIAGHIGSLPLNLYNRPDDGEARIAREHPAYWLVKQQPNPITTAAVFRETLQHHVLLHGNGRAAILRNGRGEPKELIVMRPEKWAIVIQPPQVISGTVAPQRKWHVRIDDPTTRLDDADVMHIMGLSDDGYCGLSVIDAAKQSLGLAIAQQSRAVSSERNGARVRFLLKAPPGMLRDEVKAKEFIDAFNQYHTGAENTDKAGLLREGVEAQTISQTNVESQAIEGRKFSRQDIGLLFLVEQMLGDDSSVSYNSLEMKNQAYITNCLMRWIVRWQEECAAKLLTVAERNSEEWYFRFVTAALLRGTTKERYEVYQIARQIGAMNANEVRELEDMNERTDAGGESYDNPAITVRTSQQTQASTKISEAEKDVDQPAVGDRLSRVVRAHLAQVVKVEASRAERAAAEQKNFCGWVSEFYATWTDRVASCVVECGGTRQIAEDWTRDSQERLLDVAGRVQPDGLGEAVRSEVALWQARTDQLASAVMAVGG